MTSLAPLCRRHHRAKTFGHFSYRRLADGSYEWTLPTGIRITTDPTPATRAAASEAPTNLTAPQPDTHR